MSTLPHKHVVITPAAGEIPTHGKVCIKVKKKILPLNVIE